MRIFIDYYINGQ